MLGKLNEQQLQKVAKILSIPADFVRKDFYVTKAIHLLASMESDYFSLIFQGGTSLSKGYQVITRLSEDVDYRVTLKPEAKKLGKDARRKKLRDFRHGAIALLIENGFKISDDDVKVFYEGRFMNINASFGSSKISYLKPHIAIEFFVGDLKLPTQKTQITSLIKETLGNESTHQVFPVECVALDETAAEKWVALTRRVFGTDEKPQNSDKQLVRHLYDLYQLNQKKLLSGQYVHLVRDIMDSDQEMFNNRNQAYANDPVEASSKALDMLYSDSKWEKYWQTFTEQMVYGEEAPTYMQALKDIQLISQEIFGYLSH